MEAVRDWLEYVAVRLQLRLKTVLRYLPVCHEMETCYTRPVAMRDDEQLRTCSTISLGSSFTLLTCT